jgi:hypothetical protein
MTRRRRKKRPDRRFLEMLIKPGGYAGLFRLVSYLKFGVVPEVCAAIASCASAHSERDAQAALSAEDGA